MARPQSRSQERRFKVQKDPKHRAKVTQVHESKRAYRRSPSDVQEYISELNKDYT